MAVWPHWTNGDEWFMIMADIYVVVMWTNIHIISSSSSSLSRWISWFASERRRRWFDRCYALCIFHVPSILYICRYAHSVVSIVVAASFRQIDILFFRVHILPQLYSFAIRLPSMAARFGVTVWSHGTFPNGLMATLLFVFIRLIFVQFFS